MAIALACDLCGRAATHGLLPPDVEQCRWQTAVEDWDVTLCRACRLRPLPEILAVAVGAPGGLVGGGARAPYLVHPETKETPDA